MSFFMNIPREQATRISGYTAGASLLLVILGAVLVKPIVITAGAVLAAGAAYVKLTAAKDQPRYTPTNHPMRRTEDRKGQHA
jgi:hypothetical protein